MLFSISVRNRDCPLRGFSGSRAVVRAFLPWPRAPAPPPGSVVFAVLPGHGPIMLDEVRCTGTEPSLANCSSLGWMQSNCRHDEDASVICTNGEQGGGGAPS